VDPQAEALFQAPLFAALDGDAAAALRASMHEIKIDRAQTLFAEGDPGDRLYVITDGKIKLGRTAPDGRENLLAILGQGEMFGELSLFDPGPRTATATAVTDATLFELGHNDLQPWLTGRPEVAEQLLAALARRLRRTNEAMADLIFSDVPGRVAKQLLDLARRFGVETSDGLRVAHVGGRPHHPPHPAHRGLPGLTGTSPRQRRDSRNQLAKLHPKKSPRPLGEG